MKNKDQKGLRLRQIPEERTGREMVAGLVTAFAGGAALSVSLAGDLDGISVTTMLMTAAVISLLYACLYRAGQTGWFIPVLLAAAVLVFTAGRAVSAEGFRLLWNSISDRRLLGTGMLSAPVKTLLSKERQKTAWLLISCLIGLMCSAFSSMTARHASTLPGLVSIFILTVESIWFGQAPDAQTAFLVAAAAVLLLIVNRKAASMVPWVIGLGSILLLTLLQISHWNGYEKVSAWTQSRIHSERFETELTTLPEGSFVGYQDSGEEEKKQEEPAVMTVSMEEPEEMYLRGFTGTIFSDDTWKAQPFDVLKENENLLYWQNLEGFYPAAQFQAAAHAMQMEENMQTVTVENTGACSAYLYLPFSLGDGSLLDVNNLREDTVSGDGVRSYSFRSMINGTEMIKTAAGQLAESSDSMETSYRDAEAAYRTYVYKYYLQVPEEVEELLGAVWDSVGIPETMEDAQNDAQAFLNNCFVEADNTSNLVLPLSEAEGTIWQYVTTAVLTLRHYGIPARYAEGYVITEDMAAQAGENGVITLTSENAAAWVEIYQDGIGWIPMDLSLGIEQNTKEQTGSYEHNSGSAGIKEGQSYDPPVEDEPEETEEEQTSEVRQENPRWIFLLLIPILLLLVLLLTLVIRHRIMLQKKFKRYMDEDPREGLLWIFADVIKMLEYLEIRRGNGSLKDQKDAVAKAGGDAYGEQYLAMCGLNDEALFSSHPVTKEQQEKMLQFRGMTEALLRAEKKWYQRLYLSWIRCIW